MPPKRRSGGGDWALQCPSALSFWSAPSPACSMQELLKDKNIIHYIITSYLLVTIIIIGDLQLINITKQVEWDKPAESHLLLSLVLRIACRHFGNRGSSWVWISWTWFRREVHFATLWPSFWRCRSPMDVVSDGSHPLPYFLAALSFANFI